MKTFFQKYKFLFLTTFFLCIAIPLLMLWYCNEVITNHAKGKLFSETNLIPQKNVALVLGTSRQAGKYMNAFYVNRMKATVELYKAKKIKYIIVSGDNGQKEYNEPDWMRSDLMKAGVDSSHIFCDYAGFRTFDSIVRLKKVFGQQSITIISQKFHNERALFIAHKENIDAIAFNAADVHKDFQFSVLFREKFARVKVFWDYFFGQQPTFLGPKIEIPNS